MHRLWIAAIAALAVGVSIQSAPAADLPVKAPVKQAAITNWAGWYGGIEGGWATARAAQTNTLSGVSNGYYGQQGALLGGTLGYNWQVANWILGLETDLSWSGVRGEETNCGPTRTQVCPTQLLAFGTARGRVGAIVWANTIVYATGGLAYGEIKAFKNGVNVSGGKDWRAGWTAGAGVETMFAPNWSFKVEYLYATFPGTATTYTITASNTPISAIERDIQMVRGGLNWHF